MSIFTYSFKIKEYLILIFKKFKKVGVGATLYKKYGSRDQRCYQVLGSPVHKYSEDQLFQASVLKDPPQIVLEDSFSQWVHDNADVNVDTIDGSITWHAMGGLQCITPHSSVRSEARISRLKNVPTAKATEDFINILFK